MARTITDASTDVALLDDLGQALTGLGYLTMIVTDGSRPRLEVLNRTEPERYGTVLCEGADATDRWFWWSWADRIALATDLGKATETVDRTLRSSRDAG